jgi:hypothetical protein
MSDDELTQARRGRAEVQAKLEQGGDEEDLAYWRKVIMVHLPQRGHAGMAPKVVEVRSVVGGVGP